MTAARRRRARRRRRLLAAGAGVAVVGAGGAVALATTTGSGPGLRYATVGRATLTQLVEASGTVTSSAKATPSFPVSGTVRSVAVRVGQSVSKGQVLARLDTTSLQDSVDTAESTLANARQRLAGDQSGQTSSTTGASTSTSSGPATNTASYTALTAVTAPAPAANPTIAEIRAAQRAVLTAQQAVDAGQAAVDAARHTVVDDVAQNEKLRDAQKAACAVHDDGTTGPATDGCTSARADYETFADTLTSDSTTLDAKVDAQDAGLKQLDAAIAALDRLLARLSLSTSSSGGSATAPPKGGTSTTTPTTGSGRKTTTPSTSSTGGSSTGGSSTTPTTTTASAAQLAADQAAIDAAKAQLRSARQDLGAATLRSPIAGKVAAVALAAGQSSGGGTITVVGTGVPKVTTAVPLAQIGLVKVGQPVTVAADGVTSPLHGKVTSIGMLSSTSGSVTSFPVTVQLDGGTPALYDGSGADVRITAGTAHNVVAVPNSALHASLRGGHTVTVAKGSKTTTVPVTLGVAGVAMTEVRSGLAPGDRVVLADYSQSVPASSTSNSNTNRRAFFTGGGNFPAFPGGR